MGLLVCVSFVFCTQGLAMARPLRTHSLQAALRLREPHLVRHAGWTVCRTGAHHNMAPNPLQAAQEMQDLQAELVNARHSLEMSQSALRDGQLHQTQMVCGCGRYGMGSRNRRRWCLGTGWASRGRGVGELGLEQG